MNEILQRIDKAKHIVLISHVNPDADSLGSASALYTHILRLHKKVSWFCKTKKINQKLSFIPWSENIKDSFPSSADLAISLDCGTYERLGVEPDCDLINIDHHRSNNKFGDISLVNNESISTTKVLFDLFKENDVSINPKMATALYAGLLDDSDGFMGEMVDGTTFAVIKELIECKADYKLCNRFIMRYKTLAAFRLKAIMHRKMELFFQGRVAVFCISNDDMKESGAEGQDCEDSLEESLFLPTVEVALLLKENTDFTIKGSLRSNSVVDVSKIASIYNGGGHDSRAGFTIEAGSSLKQAQDRILELINKEMYFEKKKK